MVTPFRCAASVLVLTIGSWVGVCSAQPDAPAVGQMFDQGEIDPALKGLRTPRGIKLQVVATDKSVASPAAMTFGDDGRLYVLDNQGKLRILSDSRDDGLFDKTEVLIDDLKQPAGLVVAEGWIYLVSEGRLLRRRPSDDKLLAQLQARAESKSGPPTSLSRDNRWIEQQLVRGLGSSDMVPAGGLALGADGWLYVASGGIDNRPAGWDGSQAVVLKSGAIFRMRLDGSRVTEFARGLQTPRGGPTCDPLGTVFQAETNDLGSRLIHVLEGADYGWRSDLTPPRLDRPGTLPAISLASVKQPGGSLVYRGAGFPELYQGRLVLPVAESHAVRAIKLAPDGCTFAIEGEFDLIRGDDETFRPTVAVRGPDDAIYLAADRLYRLSWSGTKEVPAIALAPLSRTKPAEPKPLADVLAVALDKTKPAHERIAAMGAAFRQWDATTRDACWRLLDDEEPAIQRLAVEALGDHLPDEPEAQQRLADSLQDRLLRGPLPVRRSVYLALGKLGTKLDTVPEWVFEATSGTPDVHANRHLFDAHARAVERPQGWATELMLGNLEVALFDPNAEPQERHRLKQFVVATAEAMRTRELSDFLDKAIADERDFFSKLDGPFQTRLLAAYANVVVDPPIHANAVAAWLEKHPSAALEVQRAAWNTLASVGTAKPEPIAALAKRLLAGKFDESLRPSVIAALQRHIVAGKPGEIDALLAAVKKSGQTPDR